MITTENLHMHTIFDDGKDSPEVMLRACREAGLDTAGVSLHSPLPFQNDWASSMENIDAFISEMTRLKQLFTGDLNVLTGIEWDVLSPKEILDRFDYVIGSVHFLPYSEAPLSVDNTPEELLTAVREGYGMDTDAAAEAYFSELLKVADEPRVNICGHFDLILKFHEKAPLFNPESERYTTSAMRALHALLDAGKVFEVNTGAISRGWRSAPYPEAKWLKEIARCGGSVLLSADAHGSANVTTYFEESEDLLRNCGFQNVVKLLTDGTFEPVPLK